MALPAIMRRLFAGDGYGPLLKDDIVSRRISIQDWSNAFDYQPATAVRGSDGKPYWSVAASGPNSGGAANPVNDGGAHWVSLPSMADIAAMNYATQSWVGSQGYATQSWVGGQGFATQSWVGGQGFATQSWVNDRNFATQSMLKGFAGTPVYVDPSGSDSNDGLSAATPVQTFAKAINIGAGLHESKILINAVGGTYSGNISIVGNYAVYVYFGGNATINGNIDLNVNSDLIVTNVSNSVTVNGYIHAFEGSSLYFNCSSLSIIESGTIGLLLDKYCSATILGSLTLSVSNTSSAITVLDNSTLDVRGDITATVDISRNTIYVVGSVFTCDSIVRVRSVDVDNNHDNVRAASALYVADGSFAQVYRLDTTNIFSNSCCVADNCSYIVLTNGGYLNGPKRSAAIMACLVAMHNSSINVGSDDATRTDCITHHSNSHAVFCGYSSQLTIYSSFLVDTYNYGTGSGNAKCVFYCVNNSFLSLTTTQTVYTLDSISAVAVFWASFCSSMNIANSVQFYGNANANPNCKKYNVFSCSALSLGGRDGNTLPGPQAGTTSSNGVIIA